MNESEVPGWQQFEVRQVIDRHFSGPSPTCEERQISRIDEWGLLKTTSVTWDGWDEAAHKVPPESYWGRTSIEVSPGDVLVTKAGPRHRVGVVACVDSTRPHLMVSGKMIALRPKKNKILPQILSGLLSLEGPQSFLNSRTTGMAESQTNFADESLLETLIDVPPMKEQIRLAEILESIDQEIRLSRQVVAKLALVVRGVTADLLVSGIGEDGQMRDHRHRHVFVESELGLVPKEWTVRRLGTWLTQNPKNGYSPVAVEEWTGTVMLGLGCISHDGFAPSQLKNAPRDDLKVQKALLFDGDLLITRSNTRDLVGLSGIYRDFGVPCSYPDLMMRLTPSAALDRQYLARMINGDRVRRQIQNYASGTSGSMVKISGAIVKSLYVAVPSISEQEQICQRIETVRRLAEAEQSTLNKLIKMRRGLANDVLSGRVRVPLAGVNS